MILCTILSRPPKRKCQRKWGALIGYGGFRCKLMQVDVNLNMHAKSHANNKIWDSEGNEREQGSLEAIVTEESCSGRTSRSSDVACFSHYLRSKVIWSSAGVTLQQHRLMTNELFTNDTWKNYRWASLARQPSGPVPYH